MQPQLPIEMINKIIYEHKGLQHPISKQIDEWVIQDGKDHIIVSRNETFIVQEKEYPRIFFEPQLDIVEEKIISHIINKDE